MAAPLFAWIIRRSGVAIRFEVYPELAGVFGATMIMGRAVDRRSWSDLDLGRRSAGWRAWVLGGLAGAAPITATCALLLGVGLLQFAPSATHTNWLGAAVRTSLVLVPAALAEELLCRGYLLTVIRESVGVAAAVVLTSVAFGLLHLLNPDATAESVTVVMLSGVALATVRLALNSLYAAWMAHLAWNWVMAVPLHAAVSGIRFESPGYHAVTSEPGWLSGGSWGPEGGLAAALSIIIGLSMYHARRRREESWHDG